MLYSASSVSLFTAGDLGGTDIGDKASTVCLSSFGVRMSVRSGLYIFHGEYFL